MRSLRLIARLDVKAPNLVKGIQLEGLRKLGDPNEFAKEYYAQGIDEIFYIDIVASLYGRNSLVDIIDRTSKNVFVPIIAGGGIRSVDDVGVALRAGADKIAINTAALQNPELIKKIAEKYGSQCMVLHIEAKRNGNSWEAYFDCGREHSGKNVIDWANQGQELGAGEIVVTSVDRDGTLKGFDTGLLDALSDRLTIPVIFGGGFGDVSDINILAKNEKIDGIAIGSALHYQKLKVSKIREHCQILNVPTRQMEDNYNG